MMEMDTPAFVVSVLLMVVATVSLPLIGSLYHHLVDKDDTDDTND